MPKFKELYPYAVQYRELLHNRQLPALVETFDLGLATYEAWKRVTGEANRLREESNRLSKDYALHKRQDQLEESRVIKQRLPAIEEQERQLTQELDRIELMLPNWLLEEVPIGEGDAFERTIEFGGVPEVWDKHVLRFQETYPDAKYASTDRRPFHHYDLVGQYVDQEKGGEVCESRFYYELDELVILDFAISMFAIEYFRERGYANKLMIPPYLMRRKVEEQITYLDAFQDTIFDVQDGGLLLIPSSEHSVIAYFKDRIFKSEELPLRVVAWSPCFRREGGSHGKDMRGIFRVKQFHKVELHSIVKEGEDLAEAHQMRQDIQSFMTALELPWRSVVVPSADADKRALLQMDIQAWFPGQGQFRETHSIATVDKWVSEKTGLRYKATDKIKKPTRNVYGTAVAVQRMICAIVENHFNRAKNAVIVPEVLRKYTMGVNEIPIGRSGAL